jgi:hypothetical protein
MGGKPRPITDRLREAYPQLATGRFVRVADFEFPAQGRLFRVESSEPEPLCRMTVLEAAPKTGGGSLVFRLSSDADALVMDNRDAAGWSMPRNWRSAEYPLHLLMLQLRSPRLIDGLMLEIRDGDPQHPPFVFGPRRLQAGWNLIELDLDHAGQFIDLADVRELRLRLQGLTQATELFLDDVVLADNERLLLAAETEDSLEVGAAGTHLQVRLAGRFAVVFREGLIAGLYDLSGDTEQAINLAGPDGLGPHWMLPNDSGPLPDPASLVLQSARQRVMQAWPGRVEIAAERQLAGGTVLYSYTVDRFGRIYWAMRMSEADQTALRVGEAYFTVSPDADLAAGEELLPPIAAPSALHPFSAVLWKHAESGGTDLLSVVRRFTTGGTYRAGLLIFGWPDASLAVWGARMAADYAAPATIGFQTGWGVTTDAGDMDNDGFSETGGYYVVQMDENLLRFVMDGSAVRRFRPSFKVVAAADKECWAYAEGLLVRDAVRTPAGEFIFTLPIDVDRPMEIEVNALAKSAEVGAVP